MSTAPHYDVELAKICAWLKANGYTMHVTLAGAVALKARTTTPKK